MKDEQIEKAKQSFLENDFYKRAKRLDAAEVIDRIEDLNYQNDSIMLMQLFLNWLEKTQKQEQKTFLWTCIRAKMRIDGYLMNMQTTLKSLSLRYLDKKHELQISEEKNNILKERIKQLENQIEYEKD